MPISTTGEAQKEMSGSSAELMETSPFQEIIRETAKLALQSSDHPTVTGISKVLETPIGEKRRETQSSNAGQMGMFQFLSTTSMKVNSG